MTYVLYFYMVETSMGQASPIFGSLKYLELLLKCVGFGTTCKTLGQALFPL